MWKSELARHIENNPPKGEDRYMVCADGKFIAYRKTANAATRLMNKIMATGKYVTAEWSAVA